MKGGVGRGTKKLSDLRRKILDRFGFKRLWFEKHGKWLELWGEFNAKILLTREDGTKESIDVADHPNFKPDLPFRYKQKPFERFVQRFDDEFKAVGYDDVEGFMQGSAASGYKYNDGNPIKLDARAGIKPSDYDVAIVSPQIIQKADEVGIDILHGPLSPEHVNMLGLSDAQLALTQASKGGIEVNFKVYSSLDDVFAYDTTIPFSLFKK